MTGAGGQQTLGRHGDQEEVQMVDVRRLYEAIINGDARTAGAVTEEALRENVDPEELLHKQVIPALDEVGRRFECNEYFVPELLISARATKAALDQIRPLLAERGAEPAGRVVIGTVKGDLHDIGKNLVSSMLAGGGFEVYDLGVDVSPEKFVSTVQEHNANIVALSALLTTTMPFMKTTIEALEKAGLRQKVKVIVGGAPVTQQYAEKIGADGYSEDANRAVALARKMSAA
jgi:5-methyltetrahydrofolate--homocysteine methyltransferase